MPEDKKDRKTRVRSLRGKVSVLVVDDEEHLARMFQTALAERGYRCHAVTSPEDALERIRVGKYDILVADILMPVMNGIELMKEVQAIKPETEVIFITAAASVETAVQTMRMGASDFLPKPFDIRDLCRRVNKVAQKVIGKTSSESATTETPDSLHCPNLPGYRIIKRIGVGSMGSVFQAHQVKLNRLVAVKLIRPSAFKNSRALKRFIQEARAAAKMNHPHIIQAYDLIEQAGYLFLIMEYFPNRPLSDIVEMNGALDWQKAHWICMQIARALVHSSSRGIIHRDVKPSNILVGRKWLAKLSDFGLAKERTIVGEPAADQGATRVGAIVGTPAYLSPEQATAVPDIDVRSDIYSLGLSFYYLLHGKPAFRGNISELLAAQIKSPLPEVTAPGIPGQFSSIIKKMTAKDRNERYQNASEMLLELRQVPNPFADGHPDAPLGDTDMAPGI